MYLYDKINRQKNILDHPLHVVSVLMKYPSPVVKSGPPSCPDDAQVRVLHPAKQARGTLAHQPPVFSLVGEELTQR